MRDTIVVVGQLEVRVMLAGEGGSQSRRVHRYCSGSRRRCDGRRGSMGRAMGHGRVMSIKGSLMYAVGLRQLLADLVCSCCLCDGLRIPWCA